MVGHPIVTNGILCMRGGDVLFPNDYSEDMLLIYRFAVPTFEYERGRCCIPAPVASITICTGQNLPQFRRLRHLVSEVWGYFLVEMFHRHRRYVAQFLQQLMSTWRVCNHSDKPQDAIDLIKNLNQHQYCCNWQCRITRYTKLHLYKATMCILYIMYYCVFYTTISHSSFYITIDYKWQHRTLEVT